MIRRGKRYAGPRLRAAMFFAAALALAYVLGLFAFVGALEQRRSEAKRADAIIALTGGDERLSTAMTLLINGRGRRLLVSGVNDDVTRDQLFEKLGATDRRAFNCCVDLGHGAMNTIGNAYESADWARRNGYRSVVLVTAAYHMPRSQIELAAAMPEVKLIPQPVFPEALETGHWWSDRQSAWLLVSEYTKFLLAWTRLSIIEPVGLSFRPETPPRIDYGDTAPGGEPAFVVYGANKSGS